MEHDQQAIASFMEVWRDQRRDRPLERRVRQLEREVARLKAQARWIKEIVDCPRCDPVPIFTCDDHMCRTCNECVADYLGDLPHQCTRQWFNGI